MKTRCFIIFLAFMFAMPLLRAQYIELFLKEAEDYLDKGDCIKAQDAYNDYKKYQEKTDKSVEKRIAQCFKDKYSGLLDDARIWLDKGNCKEAQKAYNQYKKLTNLTDKDVEKRIKNCTNPKPPKPSSHEYVDLGLPSGTKWATCNVGAKSSSDRGECYAWGETKSKKNYGWDNYKYANGTGKVTKYCSNATWGSKDNQTVLQAVDDVATAKWGDDWCTPTKEQWEELKSSCKWWRLSMSYKATGPNGNSLYLPLGGYYEGENEISGFGCYWSSSLDAGWQSDAWSARIDADGCGLNGTDRSFGLSVRPVRSSKK